MEIIKHRIEGLVELKPRLFHDERGYFFESFHVEKLHDANVPITFVQDNQSFSKKGVIRGLHFQREPYGQGKLVRVLSGRVLDVALDIRPDSPTFGQHMSCLLDSEMNNSLYIPAGFAHGFAALEDSVFFYKCTTFYHKDSEMGIRWNDASLNIDWMIDEPIISEKDQVLPEFDEVVKTLFPEKC